MSRRKNGTGTLINKGHGKPYMAKWSYKGKVYYRTTGETKREKALQVLAKFIKPYQEENEIEVLNNLIAKAKSAETLKSESVDAEANVPLDEALDTFLADLSMADVTEGTKKNYRMYFGGFTRWLEKHHPEVRDMKQVTEDLAKEFLEYEKDVVGLDTYNFRLVFYKRVWKVLGKAAGCPSNVWDKFEKRKGCKNRMRRALTMDELAKLFEHIKNDDQATLLFTVGVYTGLRRGDCCTLRWEAVDFARREIVIVPQKTKRHLSSPLHIPIHPSLYALLRARKRKVEAEGIGDGGYVLPAFKSNDKHTAVKIKKVFDDCGIETSRPDEKGHRKFITGFHSLRHTFVSLTVNGGMSPMLVQSITGHSTIKMLGAYFHQNTQALASGISKMPSVLKLQGSPDATGEPIEQTSVMLDQDVYQELLKRSGGGDVSDYLKRLLTATEKAVVTLDPMKAVA